MRMMLKFTLPVEKGNEAFTDGSLGETLDEIMGELKPEAAYFGPFEGKRGGMIFFDLAEPSQIVEVVEPLFLNLHAETELVPVMNGDDLRKGLTKAAQPTTPNPIVCFVTPTSENAKSIQAFKRDIADLRGGLNQINWQIFAANGTNDSNALDTKAKQATDYVANNVGNSASECSDSCRRNAGCKQGPGPYEQNTDSSGGGWQQTVQRWHQYDGVLP